MNDSHDHVQTGGESGHRPDGGPGESFWRSTPGIVTIAFLAIVAFFLLAEHRAHVVPWLPWLILLACPLLHVLMHGGHRGHGAHHRGQLEAPRPHSEKEGGRHG